MDYIYLIIIIALILLSLLSLIYLFLIGKLIYKLYLKNKLKSDSKGNISLVSKDPTIPKVKFDIRSNALVIIALIIMLANLPSLYYLKDVLQEYRLSKESTCKKELPNISGYVINKKTNNWLIKPPNYWNYDNAVKHNKTDPYDIDDYCFNYWIIE